jgi:hypothetical protein
VLPFNRLIRGLPVVLQFVGFDLAEQVAEMRLGIIA